MPLCAVCSSDMGESSTCFQCTDEEDGNTSLTRALLGKAGIVPTHTYLQGMFSFVGLAFVTWAILGVGIGYPGIRGVLLDEGVFSNMCTNSTGLDENGNCQAQTSSLATASSTGFAFLNISFFFAGAVMDFFSPRRAAVLGILLWIVLFTASGLFPEVGFMWAVCFGVSMFATTITYLSFLLEHTKALPFPQSTANALLMGVWDLGGIVTVLIAEVYYALPEGYTPNLLELFGSFALLTGVVAIAFLVFVFPPRTSWCCPRKDTQEDPADGIRQPVKAAKERDITREDLAFYKNQTDLHPYARTFSEDGSPFNPDEHDEDSAKELFTLRSYIRDPLYWLLIGNTTMVVTWGYFWISTVTEFMLWVGADLATAESYNRVFAILMPVLGVVAAVLTGAIVRADSVQSVRWMFGILAVCAVVALVLTVAPLPDSVPLWIHYFTFVALIMYRTVGFCLLGAIFPEMFPAGSGKGFGLLFTICGLVSVFNLFFVNIATNNDHMFLYFQVGMGSLGVIVALATVMLLPRLCQPNLVSRNFKPTVVEFITL